MKSLNVVWLILLVSLCFASENEEAQPIVLEPVEVVLVCPEGTKHEGEEVPKWVTNDEAINFFCDSYKEDTKVSE